MQGGIQAKDGGQEYLNERQRVGGGRASFDFMVLGGVRTTNDNFSSKSSACGDAVGPKVIWTERELSTDFLNGSPELTSKQASKQA